MTIREYIAQEVTEDIIYDIVQDLRATAEVLRASGEIGSIAAMHFENFANELEAKYAPGKPQLVK